VGLKNAGLLPNMKHYEIHLINAQDGYAYAGHKCCYSCSKKNLKIHTKVDCGAF